MAKKSKHPNPNNNPNSQVLNTLWSAGQKDQNDRMGLKQALSEASPSYDEPQQPQQSQEQIEQELREKLKRELTAELRSELEAELQQGPLAAPAAAQPVAQPAPAAPQPAAPATDDTSGNINNGGQFNI